MTVVTSGLQGGDRVVLDGQLLLFDGMPVIAETPEEAEARQQAANAPPGGTDRDGRPGSDDGSGNEDGENGANRSDASDGSDGARAAETQNGNGQP